jgi:peptide/nickel transport system ATP-binding protein
MTTLLEIKNLKRHYRINSSGGLFGRRQTLYAVDGISLSLQTGRTLGLVGESGCGKSTTAKLVLGHIPATEGSIHFNGQPVLAQRTRAWRAMRPEMQMVYQNPASALDRRLTIMDQVIEPLNIHQGGDKKNHPQHAHETMQAVGLHPHLYHRYPHELSGGQQQRAVLARALVLRPKLLVCDEPISALDVSIQAQVINLLSDLKKQMNLTMLFISHDLKVIRHICDDVAVLYLGKIVESGSVDEVFNQPSHPYTQALMSAVCSTAFSDKHRTRVILQGEPPNPVDVPSGCSFHPRCALASAQCKKETPALSGLTQTHQVACHLRNTRHTFPIHPQLMDS